MFHLPFTPVHGTIPIRVRAVWWKERACEGDERHRQGESGTPVDPQVDVG
jgi:hypothetical protein